MKTQDLYPYDSTISGLKNIFYSVGTDSFYINSLCVKVRNKIIVKNKPYILFYNPVGTSVKMEDVVLLDGYYKEGIVHLFMQNVLSQRIFVIDQCIDCLVDQCQFILVDLDYFIDELNAKAIQSYCGCDDAKKNSKTKTNPDLDQNDLLDFDY